MVTTYAIGNLAQEFEKMFSLTTGTKPADNYPPSNTIKIDEDEWLLQLAVAGFTKEDIHISTHKNTLTIAGDKSEQVLPDGAQYIRKGIAARKFEKTISLPDYTEVYSANVENGILSIWLLRSIPEEQKPKTIEIQ